MTEHEYDDTGRLVRTVSRRESEFDEEQQGWMLALLLSERLTCSGCGGWLPDTTTHDAGHFMVPPPWECGSCVALGHQQRAYAEDYPKNVHATIWEALERRPDGEPDGLR